MSDLNLDEIFNRSERAYGSVISLVDICARSGITMPDSVRQHFNYDVPALIGAVKRLTDELEQDRRELGRLRHLAGGEVAAR